MPALFGPDSLVADVAVDLATEGLVAEAQSQAGLGQIVQQLWRGEALQVLALEAEGLDHRVAQCRYFIVDGLAELLDSGLLLFLAEAVLEECG